MNQKNLIIPFAQMQRPSIFGVCLKLFFFFFVSFSFSAIVSEIKKNAIYVCSLCKPIEIHSQRKQKSVFVFVTNFVKFRILIF